MGENRFEVKYSELNPISTAPISPTRYAKNGSKYIAPQTWLGWIVILSVFKMKNNKVPELIIDRYKLSSKKLFVCFDFILKWAKMSDAKAVIRLIHMIANVNVCNFWAVSFVMKYCSSKNLGKRVHAIRDSINELKISEL